MEIKINDANAKIYKNEFEETFRNRGVYFKILDERSRWYNSIVKLGTSDYQKHMSYALNSYSYRYGNNKDVNHLLFNNFYYNNRFVRYYENKSYEMKIKPGTAVWLKDYEGVENIIKEAPEKRINNKYHDILNNPISIGATVIVSNDVRMYLGTVKNFKVGPSNTYVHVTPAKLDSTITYPSNVSANIKNVLVVTKDIGEQILIAKLSGG